MNATNQKGLNAVRQKIRRLTKDEPFAKDVEKYRSDPEAFMKTEAAAETIATPKRKARKIAFDLIDNTAGPDDEGFEVVGRDGKAMAYTPESILKSTFERIM
jgi:translation initiation factor 3 subunit C